MARLQGRGRLNHQVSVPDRRLGKYKLSNEEYNEFIELSGPLSYKTLDAMFKHPAYLALTDAEKLKEVKAVVEDDRDAARERMRIRIVLREVKKSRSSAERRKTLEKLKENGVLNLDVFTELKNMGLI